MQQQNNRPLVTEWAYNIACIMTQYPTQAHYPDTKPNSPCSMFNTWQYSNKQKFRDLFITAAIYDVFKKDLTEINRFGYQCTQCEIGICILYVHSMYVTCVFIHTYIHRKPGEIIQCDCHWSTSERSNVVRGGATGLLEYNNNHNNK